jgi:hypothetical protein
MQRSDFSPHSVLKQARPVVRHMHAYGGAPVAGDPVMGWSSDIHMRCVAELEEAYWPSHFASQSYYVAGRGYDQYQPALALGWNEALRNPDASFEDFEALLESEWMEHPGTSLLPWREVQQAVKDAWMHARWQIQSLHIAAPSPAYGRREVLHLLLPLYRSCLKTATELQRSEAVALDDFVQQFIDRHMRLLRSLANELYVLCAPKEGETPVVKPWIMHLQKQWSNLKMRWVEISPRDFLALCEQRERNLVVAYQEVLSKQLPQDTQDLLLQQSKQLEMQVQKLHWVRNNWSMQ